MYFRRTLFSLFTFGPFIPMRESHDRSSSPYIRYVFQDPRIWDHPERYDPDRFLPEKNPNAASLPDPWETIFGFGRRRCPGQHLASAVTMQYCAMILWAFNIRVPDGEAMPTPSTTIWRDAVVRWVPLGWKNHNNNWKMANANLSF